MALGQWQAQAETFAQIVLLDKELVHHVLMVALHTGAGVHHGYLYPSSGLRRCNAYVLPIAVFGRIV